MSYGNSQNIADLADVDVSYVTTALLAWVDAFINTHFGRNDFSLAVTETEEIHSIKNKDEESVMTKYFPIIDVTTLRDNILSSSVLTLNSLNYCVDTEAGIITLIQNETNLAAGVTLRSYFTKGTSTVDVTYSHGWASLPNEILQLANLIGAKMAKIAYLEEQSSPGAVKKIRMGNFSEERFYDSKFNSVVLKYDKFIDKMLLDLNKWRMTV